MIPLRKMNRRTALRGMMGGAAVTVGLPILDCFLNENGTAFAATGAPRPVRFGTWFWGCGLNPGRWEPTTVGEFTEFGPELAVLDPFKSKVNVYSGMKTFLDGKPNGVHFSGAICCTTGAVPTDLVPTDHPSFDTVIADTIGQRSRFRSLEVACTGVASHSQSRRGASALNPAEVSPLALYQRVFGDEFIDPNSAEFTPDPKVMVRKSALSVVTDKRKELLKQVGAADRERLDQYFTSLRELEQQLDLQLRKPAPIETCTIPESVTEKEIGTEIETVKENCRLFSKILTHAVACDQTRVINIAFADATSSLRVIGGTQSHHEFTHEEPVDPILGYQPGVAEFNAHIMGSFAGVLADLDGVKEGDGTLLDSMIMFASTDHGYAKVHGLENMPLMSIGSGSGRLNTGLHVNAVGDPVTRVGLTMQQAMGVPIGTWGTLSNETSKTITEVIA